MEEQKRKTTKTSKVVKPNVYSESSNVDFDLADALDEKNDIKSSTSKASVSSRFGSPKETSRIRTGGIGYKLMKELGSETLQTTESKYRVITRSLEATLPGASCQDNVSLKAAPSAVDLCESVSLNANSTELLIHERISPSNVLTGIVLTSKKFKS
uniref:Uncharacterized protein n=1 Tax=Parastrongyloides trichosuri TaxID=131310 RepID=A0A0N4ZHV2_PARTI